VAESASTNPQATRRSLVEWEALAAGYLNDGQNFLAHDACRAGLEQFPNSLELLKYLAIALSQTGAVDEAQRLLRPLLDEILIDEAPFRRLHETLRKAIARAVAPRAEEGPSKEALADIADLAEAIEVVRGKKLVATADAATYNSLAHVYREAWRATGDRQNLEYCRDLFLRAFHSSGNLRDGMDASVMSFFLGDKDLARELAGKVRDGYVHMEAPSPKQADRAFLSLATLGEAELMLGNSDSMLSAIRQACAITERHYPSTVKVLKQYRLLQQGGVDVPAEFFELVKPPAVVVFTGHMIDKPGEIARFPVALETAVRKEIGERLDELDAKVGYSMASCGSELLFIEAMLERGAEVNIVMPFDIEDFIEHNVRFAGPRWEMRFRNALKLAGTVTYATEERFLGHEMLYRFANQMLHGVSTLRAGFLATEPYLLAVWDMMSGSLVGGAADFIDQWEDIARLRIIDLDMVKMLNEDVLAADAELAGLADETLALIATDGNLDTDLLIAPTIGALPAEVAAPEHTQSTGRVIRSMLFADIAGYSKLKEEHIPSYLEFLGMLRDGVAGAASELISINTWGDAIFAVMTKATPMAEYALTLQEVVNDLGRRNTRFPAALNLRISLHAGPVFEAIDPIAGRPNFYGSHINRAARLEPVTVIGHVYATQQFVAVLTAEQSANKTEVERNGVPFEDRFHCDYVGVLSLAKDFGRQTVYHLRRKINPHG
jgi:class 3 adenylate cyclase